MMTTNKAALLTEIIASLRADAGAWSWTFPDRRYLISHRSGVQLWVSRDFYVDQPRKVTFGFFARWRLRRAFRRWRRYHGAREAGKLDTQNVEAVRVLLRSRRLRAAA